jgi:hypothetical protein
MGKWLFFLSVWSPEARPYLSGMPGSPTYRCIRGPHGQHDPHPSCTVGRPAVRQPSMPPSTFMTWE